VTYKATDQSDNSSSCATTIRVTDTAPPIFDPASLGPRTVVGSCSNTPLSFALPTASDACTTPTVSCDALSGASFGSNLVHCTATDASGNVTHANLVVNVLQPLHVIFDPPLKDDNVADDVNTDADVNNLFTVGQVIPHNVRLLDCPETDVTTTVPVTVKLVVSKGATGGGTDLINDVGDFSGIGDVGGLMILVGNHYQFNLKTNKDEYPSGGAQFQSLVTVSYTSAPGLAAGVEDARLVSR